ncbi:MAG: hypothetical protein QXP71_05705 [Desulfurococcaceae archaeon]|uniref:Uncharacterized protein n=1 Tax=Staphylothermus marinus TaxID=2280 RepID=A0A7C4D7K1_STAMA
MIYTNSEEIVFEGIVIGYEELENIGKVLYLTGRINNTDCFFYLKVSKNMYEEYVLKGIGRLISGRGLIISRNPLIVEYEE